MSAAALTVTFNNQNAATEAYVTKGLEYLQEADDHFQEKRIRSTKAEAAAERNFNLALGNDPDHPIALGGKSEIENIRGNFPKALALARQALDLEPENPFLLNAEATALAKIGKIKDALSSYEKASALRPSDPVPLMNSGIALSILGEQKQAMSKFNEVTDINPDYDPAWFQKAKIFHKEGKIDEAIECLKSAALHTSDIGQIYYLLGTLYFEKNQLEHALEHWRRSVEVDASILIQDVTKISPSDQIQLSFAHGSRILMVQIGDKLETMKPEQLRFSTDLPEFTSVKGAETRWSFVC